MERVPEPLADEIDWLSILVSLVHATRGQSWGWWQLVDYRVERENGGQEFMVLHFRYSECFLHRVSTTFLDVQNSLCALQLQLLMRPPGIAQSMTTAGGMSLNFWFACKLISTNAFQMPWRIFANGHEAIEVPIQMCLRAVCRSRTRGFTGQEGVMFWSLHVCLVVDIDIQIFVQGVIL